MEPAILCVGTLHLAHSLLKEGLLAYFAQQNRPDGVPLGSEHLLHLATGAGASALGLDQVGHLSVGMDFDAVWFRPQQGSTTEVVLRHAARAGEALAKIFTLGTLADLAGVWVAGRRSSLVTTSRPPPSPPVMPTCRHGEAVANVQPAAATLG